MFAGMVLLGAPYTLKMNEHVRVDLFYGMLASERTQIWIDIICGVLFLLPICVILTYFTWPWFVESWNINEASSNAGGLIRWPVKLLLPVGFRLWRFKAFRKSSSASPRLSTSSTLNSSTKSRCNELDRGKSRAPDVCGHDSFHAHRISGGILACCDRPVLWVLGHRIRPDPPRLSRQPDLPIVRYRLERPVVGDSVFHLYGRHSRTLRSRGRPARFIRSAVRASARRSFVCRNFRRRHSWRDHRYRGSVGHRHGRDLDDADAQIRLLGSPYHGRDRGVRHDYAAHSALTCACRAGRSDGAISRRHVCRRDRAEHHSGPAVLRLGADRQHHLAG